MEDIRLIYVPGRDVILNGPIEGQIEMSFKAYARLKYARVRTVAQLVAMTERELLDIRWLGQGILANIKEGLAREGLQLKG